MTGNTKKITRSEAQIIFDAGLSFFPIYQTSADENSYFTSDQGAIDANAAIAAAAELGIPKNTIIYFAVDYDCLDYQITSNVIPYFKSVHEVMSNSNTYRVGIYGTRNVCTRVSNKGYAESSFVGDMSTGFSGNLGFGMPSNWAFDQFYTTSIGSGSGCLEIDKDGFSGLDSGVFKLDELKNPGSDPDIVSFSQDSIELEGPTVNIFGKDTALFKTKLDWKLDLDKLVDCQYNITENTYQITIGLKDPDLNPSAHATNFKDLKAMVRSFNGYTPTAINDYQKLKHELKTVKFNMGFAYEGTIGGYIEIDAATGKVRDGGMFMIAELEANAEIPLSVTVFPLTYFRFEISGSLKQQLYFALTETGQYGINGNGNYSVTLMLVELVQ